MELREKIIDAINASWDDEDDGRTVQSAADAILAIPEIRDALECYSEKAGQLDRISERISRLADEGKIRSA